MNSVEGQMILNKLVNLKVYLERCCSLFNVGAELKYQADTQVDYNNVPIYRRVEGIKQEIQQSLTAIIAELQMCVNQIDQMKSDNE